jgi:hypothetical protein
MENAKDIGQEEEISLLAQMEIERLDLLFSNS